MTSSDSVSSWRRTTSAWAWTRHCHWSRMIAKILVSQAGLASDLSAHVQLSLPAFSADLADILTMERIHEQVFLPMSVPSILQDSLGEEWERDGGLEQEWEQKSGSESEISLGNSDVCQDSPAQATLPDLTRNLVTA